MFIIFGWLRRFTILGIKIDECTNCGQVCQHVVGRKTNWGHLFWFPVLFLGFSHGMLCSTCGTWTPLPWQSVRAAMKLGVLPLDRARPNGPALLAAAAAESGEPPLHPSAVFDRLLVNPKRGPWDMYLKVWPVLVAAIWVIGVVSPRTSTTYAGGTTPYSQPASNGSLSSSISAYGPAHACWEALDGSVNGCRLASGAIMGVASGTPMTCYFKEPLSASDTSVHCSQ